jgi:hypothetical protein
MPDKMLPKKGFSKRSLSVRSKMPEAVRVTNNPERNSIAPRIRTIQADCRDTIRYPLKRFAGTGN